MLTKELWDWVFEDRPSLNLGVMIHLGFVAKAAIEHNDQQLYESLRNFGFLFRRHISHRAVVGDLEKSVRTERERQDNKWGAQTHSHCYWLGILVEELGEWAEVRYDHLPEREAEEAVHVLAVLFAWLEFWDQACLTSAKRGA